MLKSERGFSLIEIMIASSISLAAVGSVIHMHSLIFAHTSRQLQTDHLRNTVQDILFLMEIDIRRSGYWAFDEENKQLHENPFQTAGNDLRVQSYTSEPADSCLLYSYDINKNGKVGVGTCRGAGCTEDTDASNVEQLGFRLKNKALQMRYAGSPLTCSSGRWQALTEKTIIVSKFQILLETQCQNLSVADAPCLIGHNQQLSRKLIITLSAHRKDSNIAEVTASKTIHIKNDKLLFTAATP
ncbi:MAG: prepilin-type N-terminal cleavage/methylation domain-containing protein [Gammaproteobacteria bacterium]